MAPELARDLLVLLEQNPVPVNASGSVRYAQIVMALRVDANPPPPAQGPDAKATAE